MDRESSWAAIERQRLAIAGLLTELTPEEWAAPSLCAGWRVRDVAAHIALTPQPMPLRTLLAAGLRARGDYNRMIDRLTVAHAKHPVAELVSQIRDQAASRRLPGPTNYRNILFDIIVHGQDIAIPLGRTLTTEPAAVAAAATTAAGIGRPIWDAHRLDGLRLRATDIDWEFGAGREIRGPVLALLLLVTGRTALRHELTGDGTDFAIDRLTRSRRAPAPHERAANS
ncbi:maleylpyruvate isomerase family mycothiol-dependent enzyme [Nocardia aurantia]|uniref:Mycothiol-dependent maleylpyruvate isomerase metal-binding domain-containing protein n=1 Tax=Nocardia aurantia TaxID=2585199 RepID=A0A7K0DJS9_9NOCA|nr:maleylpyruvate isomerase family mycothiol-dependent enzyme [Nocardia aurantia]MQY25492.1 hypothetical protein [Nocardia aurantia]